MNELFSDVVQETRLKLNVRVGDTDHFQNCVNPAHLVDRIQFQLV